MQAESVGVGAQELPHRPCAAGCYCKPSTLRPARGTQTGNVLSRVGGWVIVHEDLALKVQRASCESPRKYLRTPLFGQGERAGAWTNRYLLRSPAAAMTLDQVACSARK